MPGTYPENQLFQFPTGRWGFVGRVDYRLAFIEGTERVLSFATRTEALDAANLIGVTVDESAWSDANGAPRVEVKPATDATSLKRYFKARFGIAVRVTSGKGKGHWITVWIPSDRRKTGESMMAPLRYSATFPMALGSSCLRIIYPNNPDLWNHWCGNVSAHSISMSRKAWEELLALPPETLGATA